jgi:hypothetical protein
MNGPMNPDIGPEVDVEAMPTSEPPPQRPLHTRILQAIGPTGAMGVTQLARELDADKQEVAQCLESTLQNRVWKGQDSKWRWTNKEKASPAYAKGQWPELHALCNYLLASSGEDGMSADGVQLRSTATVASCANAVTATPMYLASAPGHSPGQEYVELPYLPSRWAPSLEEQEPWPDLPEVQGLLERAAHAQDHKAIFLGFPVRLSRDQPPTGQGKPTPGVTLTPVLLWRVRLGMTPEEPASIEPVPPIVNPAFVHAIKKNSSSSTARIVGELVKDLGLNGEEHSMYPWTRHADELRRLRPLWGCKEPLDSDACGGSIPLADLRDVDELGGEGVYNRAILLCSGGSSYTRSRQRELRMLATLTRSECCDTALALWMGETDPAGSGDPLSQLQEDEPQVVHEVMPMNDEQRLAVNACLANRHTVINGPPGTGKSQLLVNLVANALLRNMTVLIASHNNQAVDEAVGRLTVLCDQPLVLRHQDRNDWGPLVEHVQKGLGPDRSVAEPGELRLAQSRFARNESDLDDLDEQQAQIVKLLNEAQSLDDKAAEARRVFSGLAPGIGPQEVLRAQAAIAPLRRALKRATRALQPLHIRLLWWHLDYKRLHELALVIEQHEAALHALGITLPPLLDERGRICDLGRYHAAIDDLKTRTALAQDLVRAREARQAVSDYKPDELARSRSELLELKLQESQRIWKAWVNGRVQRLSDEQKAEVAEFLELAPYLTQEPRQALSRQLMDRARELRDRILPLIPCQAATMLSVSGRIPLEAGAVDLLIIDEASQCDLASTLPLLYRAKRSLIIGDPTQQHHITTVPPERDAQLAASHLGEASELLRTQWRFSSRSLYDLGDHLAKEHLRRRVESRVPFVHLQDPYGYACATPKEAGYEDPFDNPAFDPLAYRGFMQEPPLDFEPAVSPAHFSHSAPSPFGHGHFDAQHDDFEDTIPSEGPNALYGPALYGPALYGPVRHDLLERLAMGGRSSIYLPAYPPLVQLNEHMRCHRDIAEYCNRQFYLGRLRVVTSHSRLRRPAPHILGAGTTGNDPTAYPAITWQHVSGRVSYEGQGSASNPLEARAVVEFLQRLIVEHGFRGTVGVVTPFRPHAELLNRLVQQDPILARQIPSSELRLATATSFQGNERDLIVFSPVVSDNVRQGSIHFLRNTPELFNVAVSRARGQLHVIGNRHFAAACDVHPLSSLLAYVDELAERYAKRLVLDASMLGPYYPQLPHLAQVPVWERRLFEGLYAAGICAIPRLEVENEVVALAVRTSRMNLAIEVDSEHASRPWTYREFKHTHRRDQRLVALGWGVRRFMVGEVRDDLSGCVERVVGWVEANG